MFIRSERLMLRPIFAEDWREVLEGLAEERIVRMLFGVPWPYTADQARAFCRRPRDSADMLFAITLPGDNGAPVIGVVGLTRKATGDIRELECWIARNWQRQGYGNEAVGALLATARSLGIHKVVAKHFLDNLPGSKILQK